jgi:thiol-disulfide isomerase/thioredoxin
MRMRGSVLLAVIWALGTSGAAAAQEGAKGPRGAPEAMRPYYSSVTDPACPVTDGSPPVPISTELRVLYFPTGIQATIHDPKSLVLHIAFDEGIWRTDFETVQFSRRDDGVWQATVSLTVYKNKYAIYYVEEPEAKQTDTNDGKYFEVLFCTPRGEHPDRTIQYQAESYGGRLEPHGFQRPTNYAKAIEILEENIHPPDRGGGLINRLWLDKLLAGGETAETKAALLTEIRQFIRDHAEDNFGLLDAMNFVSYQEWIPIELGNELADAIQKHEKGEDGRFDAHVTLLSGRIWAEKDKEKRLEGIRDLITKYPQSEDAEQLRVVLFSESKDLPERERLYEWIRVKYPSMSTFRVALAQAYLDGNIKLREAMRLLDEADKLADADLADPAANADRKHFAGQEKKSIMVLRADLLTRTGKPKEALAMLLPEREHFRRGHSFYVLGTALEKTGQRREALDAYMEASVRPGESQYQATEAMERLWFKLKMGSRAEMMNRTESLSERVFRNDDYKPKLVSRPAPELDLTTMGGEHFSSASLRGKPFVLNFWATWCGPCVYELKGLEEFQAKHPEIAVLTVVKDDTEPKDLQDVLKARRVAALRISKVPAKLFDEYGAIGVPHTFVIDEAGMMRVHHFEGLEDATRILEADLAAIRAEGTGR